MEEERSILKEATKRDTGMKVKHHTGKQARTEESQTVLTL